MIKSFGNQLAEDIFYNKSKTRSLKQFPPELLRIARRKILYLHEADSLTDLKVPPANRLKALKGDLKGFYSIRINDQWRLVFRWGSGASEVKIIDYHN